jgi:peptidoglycan/LPS O-acetylase OafA/YrhL
VSFPKNSLLYFAFLPTHLMWSGVDLFFVLSGFLIGGILLDRRESQGYYSVFYLRRVHRIFPLYFLMIALLIAGVWIFPRSPLFKGSLPLWVYPIFAQNLMGNFLRAPFWIAPAWSLAIEEQFYLIFPCIVRRLSRRALLVFLAICILGAPLLRTTLLLSGLDYKQIHPLLPCRADALALGAAAAIVARNGRAKAWIAEHSKALYGCLLALPIAAGTMLKWADYWYQGTIGYSIFGLMYFLLVVLLLLAPVPLLTRIFRARWLGWLGSVSYCVYLIHEPVIGGLFLLIGRDPSSAAPGLPTLLVTSAALAIVLLTAQASWAFLERPLIRRAHARYRYLAEGSPVAAAAAPQ